MSATIGGIYIAHKRTRSVGLTTMGAALINLVIDLMFVKAIGISAGSISTMVSYFYLLVFRMIDVQKFQSVKFEIKTSISGTLILALMGMLLIRRDAIGNVANIVLCVIVLIVYDRAILLSIAKMVLSKLKKSKVTE